MRPGVKLAVVDRNFSMGHHGIFCEEIKSALYALPAPPQVFGYVAGRGGGDITPELLREAWEDCAAGRGDLNAPIWLEDSR